MDAKEELVGRLINKLRGERGLPELILNEDLATAARYHSVDLGLHPNLMHSGSDGSDGGERIWRAGYTWREWNEVVGWGWNGSEEMVVKWWSESPAHLPILLSPCEEMGVGYATGGPPWYHYWTVCFGSR